MLVTNSQPFKNDWRFSLSALIGAGAATGLGAAPECVPVLFGVFVGGKETMESEEARACLCGEGSAGIGWLVAARLVDLRQRGGDMLWSSASSTSSLCSKDTGDCCLLYCSSESTGLERSSWIFCSPADSSSSCSENSDDCCDVSPVSGSCSVGSFSAAVGGGDKLLELWSSGRKHLYTTLESWAGRRRTTHGGSRRMKTTRGIGFESLTE